MEVRRHDHIGDLLGSYVPYATRPYLTASTIAANESRRTISAASIAMADPEPIAIPISAAFNEGASLTPSPVTVSRQLHALRE